MSKGALLLLVLILLIVSCIMAEPALSSTNLAENSWTPKTSMPTAGSGYGIGAAVVNGKIYVIGNDTHYEYDPATDAWSSKKPMPTPRYSCAIAACQNKIYVIGGVTYLNPNTGISTNCPLNEVYDPATDTWETKEPMPTARSQMEANTVNGKIYVIGGRTGGMYTTVAFNEVYDLANNSWTRKAPIPYPVVLYASAVVNNKIYVIGGQDEFDSSMNLDTNQIYDPETDTWSMGKSAPVIVWQATAGATTGIMAPKRIYVMGGIEGIAAPLNQNLVYDPAADVWSSGASMPFPRTGFTIAAVNDLLYAIGGNNGWTISYSENQQYIPFGYGTIPPEPEPEPFPTALVVTASGASATVVGIGLLVYFRKRKR